MERVQHGGVDSGPVSLLRVWVGVWVWVWVWVWVQHGGVDGGPVNLLCVRVGVWVRGCVGVGVGVSLVCVQHDSFMYDILMSRITHE